MPSLCIRIPADFDGNLRLDHYVAALPHGMSRSHLKASAQEILLNGKNAKLSAKVSANDIIDILWEDEIPENIEPEDIPLAVIYEDDNVTIVNKRQATGRERWSMRFYIGGGAKKSRKSKRDERTIFCSGGVPE